MSLPTEWEECAGIDDVEIKLSGGALLFRHGGGAIIGWWVRPPSIHSTTAVLVLNERGGNQRLGGARTFPKARDLVARHLGR